MNCFARVLTLLDPGDLHQGQAGMLYSILKLADAADLEGADSYTNCVTKSLDLLRPILLPNTLTQLAAMLAELDHRIQSGAVR